MREIQGHISMKCPHCGAKARVRTSREETPLVREVRLQCSDVECGHTWAAKLEATHTLSPSGKPNPDVSLPTLPRAGKTANDNVEAVDPPPPAAAAG